MKLYQMLFGRLMAPEDDGSGCGAGGAAADRGDNIAAEPAAQTDNSSVEEDVKVATGADPAKGTEDGEGDGQPRDKDGKFAKKEREPAIPKTRFDEAVRRERERAEAAERQLEEIRRQQQAVSRGADIGKLEEQVKELRAQERKALISGDEDKAAALSEQADRMNRQIAIEQSRDMSVQAKEMAREEIRWDLTIERIESEYPALDEKSDEFDQDLTDDVVDKMNGYMKRDKLPRSEALLKAVKYVLSRQQTTTNDEGEKKGLDRGQSKDRKEAAVAKNIDASKRQPASLNKVGADSDKNGKLALPEVEGMTYEEFEALPEATRAKMRGDAV